MGIFEAKKIVYYLFVQQRNINKCEATRGTLSAPCTLYVFFTDFVIVPT